jgi:hypothetical protein
VPPPTLKAWLAAANLNASGAHHTREEAIDRAVREYGLLKQVVAQLSAADFDLPLPFGPEAKDRWTVKDAVAHITYWKADVARIASGKRLPRAERQAMGSDPNHFIYLQWRDRPPQDVVAWHDEVQNDLLAALRAAPEVWFTKKKPHSWWPANVDHHPAQHRRDIERALGAAARSLSGKLVK